MSLLTDFHGPSVMEKKTGEKCCYVATWFSDSKVIEKCNDCAV